MNLTEVHHLIRLTDVKRWGIVHVTREQSVAEHAFRVWLLATSLYDACVPVPHNSIDRESVSYWALLHDADEIWTGDLPSNVKALIEEVAPGALKRLKDKVLTENVPYHAGRARGAAGSIAERVVKIADCVEAYNYYSRYSYNERDRVTILQFLRNNLEKAVKDLQGVAGWGFNGNEVDIWEWVDEALQRI